MSERDILVAVARADMILTVGWRLAVCAVAFAASVAALFAFAWLACWAVILLFSAGSRIVCWLSGLSELPRMALYAMRVRRAEAQRRERGE